MPVAPPRWQQASAPEAALQTWLVQHRNRDGGWSYYPSKASRLEPTCWALLALSRHGSRPPGVDVISQWPRRAGWLTDAPRIPANYAFNALAALTLHQDAGGRQEAIRLARALAEARGNSAAPLAAIRQNNGLRAWPWIDATFSWVEPTSLCLLLLKKLRQALPEDLARERIAVGESMLLDRACVAGGWNYGGSNAFGKDLPPYVPTTALALLAMQDRPANPTIARAVRWLLAEAAREPSALALALIALRVFRSEVRTFKEQTARMAPSVIQSQNTVAIATSLYALGTPLNEADAFEL
jgi:hypothetical protein